MYSIELTSTNIHIVGATSKRNGVKVKSAFSVPMPAGAYFNGYIKDYASVAKVIRNELLGHNIKGGQFYFVLDSTAIKTKEMVVPDESHANIISILEKEMADIIVSEDHILDYTVYHRFRENKKWYLNCILYAVPRDLITEFVKVSEECGIRVRELELHHNSMEKLWEIEDPKIKRSIPKEGIKDNIKKSKTKKTKNKAEQNLEKYEDEEMWEPLSTIHINQKIQLWIGVYQDSVKMITNAIDGNCYSRTVPVGSALQEFASFDPDAKKNQIMFYIDQIQSFLQFLNTVNKNQPLEAIQIYGDQEDIGEVMDILRQEVSCPIEYLHKPRKISGINETEYPVYCSAIGAMLRR